MMPAKRYKLTANLLLRLKGIADARNVVAMVTVATGHTVFIEPAAFGAVLGIGLTGDAGRAVRMDQILRRRFENPVRFCGWLPARMSDQSSFLLRRLAHAECVDVARLARIDFSIPLELLAT